VEGDDDHSSTRFESECFEDEFLKASSSSPAIRNAWNVQSPDGAWWQL
jgi:hypothetical protein